MARVLSLRSSTSSPVKARRRSRKPRSRSVRSRRWKGAGFSRGGSRKRASFNCQRRRYSSDGLKRVPVDASGLTTFDMDRDRATRLFGAYSMGKWTAEGIFSSRTKGIPTGAYDVSLTDPASETADERGFLGVRYEGAVRGTSVLWSGAYDWYNYDGVYSDATTEDHLKDFAYGKWWSSEVTASRRLQKHLVTTGAEVRDNVQQDQGVYYGAPGSNRVWVINDKRTSSQWALFGQDEFKPTRWAIVSAGVRYDHWPTFGGTTNPRVGLILKPRPNTSFKVMHGTAFRAPNLYELYYSGDFSEVLKPERIRTTEVAWEQYLRWPDAPHRLGIPLPHSRSDLAGRRAGPLRGHRLRQRGCHRCVGRRSGSRTQLGTCPGDRQLRVHLDQERRRRRAVEQLAATSAVGRFTTPLLHRRATFGMEWVYTSSRRTITGEETSGFALGNLTVTSGELAGRLKVSVDVHNLLDRTFGSRR